MSAAEDVGRSCLTRDNYEIGISLLGEDRSILLATTRLDLRRELQLGFKLDNGGIDIATLSCHDCSLDT